VHFFFLIRINKFSNPRTRQSLRCLWMAYVDEFDGGNYHFVASLDSFQHPLPPQVASECWLSLVWLQFAFFLLFSHFFPSLSSSYWVLAMQKNYIIPSISFSFDSVLLLLIIIILFALIIFNWILFRFHPRWFDFVNFFFNLVFIILIDIFFSFESFY
jgi:hypothetical protein